MTTTLVIVQRQVHLLQEMLTLSIIPSFASFTGVTPARSVAVSSTLSEQNLMVWSTRRMNGVSALMVPSADLACRSFRASDARSLQQMQVVLNGLMCRHRLQVTDRGVSSAATLPREERALGWRWDAIVALLAHMFPCALFANVRSRGSGGLIGWLKCVAMACGTTRIALDPPPCHLRLFLRDGSTIGMHCNRAGTFRVRYRHHCRVCA
mmetsp:Transcript_16123/g.36143  ORF Transcript_16123/g.36143 Transcript_16123/m.36143 type:complete len:209 (-) Transcript_16123:24-650(-)